MLFFLGVEAWCFSFGGFGSLVLHLQSQVLLFHCRRLAGLLGQLVATLFGFGGAACSYFGDFDSFIVDLDGYS